MPAGVIPGAGVAGAGVTAGGVTTVSPLPGVTACAGVAGFGVTIQIEYHHRLLNKNQAVDKLVQKEIDFFRTSDIRNLDLQILTEHARQIDQFSVFGRRCFAVKTLSHNTSTTVFYRKIE